jgi:two-component system, OmpR family, sensor histidine kinase BaeS
VTAALGVSWYFSRRVQRSISPVTIAAFQVAAGRYDTRVPDPGLGGKFASLTRTFNARAERLGADETTRRRMLADLAHEMRIPLATIEAHLEAVEDGVRELDQTTLGVLHASTRPLGRLAEDIGAVSCAEEGRLDIDPRRSTQPPSPRAPQARPGTSTRPRGCAARRPSRLTTG